MRLQVTIEVHKFDYERYRVYAVAAGKFRQLATLSDGPRAVEYAKGLATMLGGVKHWQPDGQQWSKIKMADDSWKQTECLYSCEVHVYLQKAQQD